MKLKDIFSVLRSLFQVLVLKMEQKLLVFCNKVHKIMSFRCVKRMVESQLRRQLKNRRPLSASYPTKGDIDKTSLLGISPLLLI